MEELKVNKLKQIRIWKCFAINGVIAIIVCMFYIVPLLEHMQIGGYSIYDKSIMHTDPKEVFTTTLGFSDLFASEFGNQEIRFSIGIMTIVLSLLGLITYKKIKKEYKSIYLSFLLIAIISIIMSSKLFPWFIMPSFMGVIQFAWRNLGFFAFFISLVCAINTVTFAEELVKKDWVKDTFLFAIIISISVFSALGVMRDWKFGNLENEKNFDKYFSQNERIYPYSINREYLPIKALDNIDYMIKRDNKSFVISGNADIKRKKKNKLKDELYLENVTDGTVIELPYIYYLGYDIKVIYNFEDEENGTKTEKDLDAFESDKGFIRLNNKQLDNIEKVYNMRIE